MKNLSLARQHFDLLIENNCIYVDKTEQIFQLVTEFPQVFYSRPRRFGKSLLLSTIAQLFLGRRDLFAGLWIENRWDWDKNQHPVVHFYMDKTYFHGLGLENGLRAHLQELAREHGVVLESQVPEQMLAELLAKIEEKTGKKVVLLFDEYDKPINDYLEDIPTAERHREMLSNFYGVLKPNSDRLRFLMLTGVSKFSHVSIFSKLNQLIDLTFNKDYLTLLGYTEADILQNFEPYLVRAEKDMQLDREELMQKVKFWYNGYSWDGIQHVYNPVSLMRFFQERDLRNYWFTTGTPTFLVNQLKNRECYDLENIIAGQHIFDNFTLQSLEINALLLQTGYVTVKEKLPNQLFRLGYPNHEVRVSMLDNLMRAFGQVDASLASPNVFQLREAFYQNDIPRAIDIINNLFEHIPYQLTRKQYEADYHAMLFLVFRYLAIDADAEVSSARGRTDAVLKTPHNIFVLEFKIDQSAEKAMQYLRQQGYAEKFRHDGRPVQLLAINFSRRKQMVTGWKLETL